MNHDKTKKGISVKGMLLASAFFFLMSPETFAQSTELISKTNAAFRVKEFYCHLAATSTGPLGVLLGLAIALYGFYKFIMSGSLQGVAIVIVGALVPTFPSVIATFSEGMALVFPNSGGNNGSTFRMLNAQCHVYSENPSERGKIARDPSREEVNTIRNEKEAMKDAEDVLDENLHIMEDVYGTLNLKR